MLFSCSRVHPPTCQPEAQLAACHINNRPRGTLVHLLPAQRKCPALAASNKLLSLIDASSIDASSISVGTVKPMPAAPVAAASMSAAAAIRSLHPLSREALLSRWHSHADEPHKQVQLFHAHVYWTSQADLPTAVGFHNLVSETFASDSRVQTCSMCNRPVGPHTNPMFEVIFSRAIFADILVWLTLNRPQKLHVLIHLVTPEVVADHTTRAIWVGPELSGAINASILTNLMRRAEGLSDVEVLSMFS